MIPQILHRVWLDDPLPEAFADYGMRWRELHPGWEIREWRDSAELPSLRNRSLFDRARELYPRPAWEWRRFEADLLRLELLEQYGGVYVDADVEPLANVASLLDGRICLVGRSPQSSGGVHAITNAVMAAVPGHPWIAALVDGVTEAVRKYGHRPLAQCVGPWHLNRTYEAGRWSDVTVLEPEVLYEGGWLRHDWNSAARRRGGGVW